jgi:hypothetical protein
VTWDAPGRTESLVVRPGLADVAGAVWDVTSRQPWARCITSPISDVVLRYHPWDDVSGAFWCTRVSIFFGDRRVELLLGDREPEGGQLSFGQRTTSPCCLIQMHYRNGNAPTIWSDGSCMATAHTTAA